MVNIGALIITYTSLGVPYFNHSIVYPKALFELLRPRYEFPVSFVCEFRQQRPTACQALYTSPKVNPAQDIDTVDGVRTSSLVESGIITK